jgi:hypothetical protein
LKRTYHASCHCGQVRLECELDLSEGTSRCNCSMCTKGRFWKAIARADAFRLVQGEDALAKYEFGRHAIQHRFCRHCGVKVFGKGHLDELGGDFYAVSVACLDDASDEDLAAAPVQYEDGRNDRWERQPQETGHL